MKHSLVLDIPLDNQLSDQLAIEDMRFGRGDSSKTIVNPSHTHISHTV